jgi:hypothetical protein
VKTSNTSKGGSCGGVVAALSRLARRILAACRARSARERAYLVDALSTGASATSNTRASLSPDRLGISGSNVTNPRLFLRTLAAEGRAVRRVRAISEPITQAAQANVILLEQRRRTRA